MPILLTLVLVVSELRGVFTWGRLRFVHSGAEGLCVCFPSPMASTLDEAMC